MLGLNGVVSPLGFKMRIGGVFNTPGVNILIGGGDTGGRVGRGVCGIGVRLGGVGVCGMGVRFGGVGDH